MQGKLFQRCTYFLYCSVLSLGGKVNTRRISQPDMQSIFTKKNYQIFWSGNHYLNFKKLSKFNAFILFGYYKNTDASFLVYKFWFQYVRKVYATAINLPCISTLIYSIDNRSQEQISCVCVVNIFAVFTIYMLLFYNI